VQPSTHSSQRCRRGDLITDAFTQIRRRAALLVALFTIAVGMVGIMHPDTITTLRRSYFATPGRLHAAGALRVAMGLVIVLAASSSRWPKTVRALGAVMCLQGCAAVLMGPERARAILEWETLHPALLRSGAVAALVTGVFFVYAMSRIPSERRTETSYR
jgi:hypothetical protein